MVILVDTILTILIHITITIIVIVTFIVIITTIITVSIIMEDSEDKDTEERAIIILCNPVAMVNLTFFMTHLMMREMLLLIEQVNQELLLLLQLTIMHILITKLLAKDCTEVTQANLYHKCGHHCPFPRE